jgi:hypothetical protein
LCDHSPSSRLRFGRCFLWRGMKAFRYCLSNIHRISAVRPADDMYDSVVGGLINYAFTAMCFRKSCSTEDPAWKAAKRTFGVQLYFQGALSVYAIWAAYSLSQKMALGTMTRGAGWILLGKACRLCSGSARPYITFPTKRIRSSFLSLQDLKLARAPIYD